MSGRSQRAKKPSGKETQILRWEEIAMKETHLSFEGEDNIKVTPGSLRPWSGHANALGPGPGHSPPPPSVQAREPGFASLGGYY